MARERLPNRRPSESRTLEFDGRPYHVTVGFDPAGNSPREVFIRDRKEGSEMSFLLDDASVMMSLALQHGVRPRELVRSIARNPTAPLRPTDLATPAPVLGRAPASVLGVVADLLVELDEDHEP